ncbi:MAG: hypothetical protein IJ573_10225 [Clostridia bacterium]|nr:hypothetical protein [Clostridia bacterium]
MKQRDAREIKRFAKRILRKGISGFTGLRMLYAGRRFADRGLAVYLRLREKYGENARFYVNHYPGTGDIYLTSMFMPAWAKRHPDERAVVTVIGKGGEKVAKLFPLQDVEVLSQQDTKALIRFYELCGDQMDIHVEILHYHAMAMNSGILERFAGYKGLDFLSIYLGVVFPGLTPADAAKPAFSENDPAIDALFDRYGLQRRKTVLLVPYANTIDEMSDQFWTYLVAALKEKGYSVCTNVSGDEEPLPGTEGVFVPYRGLRQFLETAGVTIQLRCGLTDMIAGFDCKKIILYPVDNFFQFGTGSLYDYFSLKNMDLSQDAVEIEFSRWKGERLVYERILEAL